MNCHDAALTGAFVHGDEIGYAVFIKVRRCEREWPCRIARESLGQSDISTISSRKGSAIGEVDERRARPSACTVRRSPS